jgi:hypothetical protein
VAGQRFLSLKSNVHQTTVINSSAEEEDFELPIADNSFAVWASTGIKKNISGRRALFLDVNYESSFLSNSGKISVLAVRAGFMF